MTKKQKKELRSILIAGILYACLLILEHVIHIPALFERWYLALAVYLVPYCIVGWSVLRKAGLGVRNRQVFDESFLMTIATIGAFATRENSEAVAVMLFYQIGEFFQGYAVGKSRQSIRDLMDIAPEFANVLREDGSIEVIDPDDVEIDDILVIKPGERIPVDGIVTEGEGLINTSALTGESVPRTVRAGSDLVSGCINGDSLLHMRAVKVYDDSTVARILELVETASEKKSRTENFITRFARWYTPIVVIGAVILALIPPLFFGHWSDWIIRACTFLVISCPCALVISVPLAFFGGIGAASRAGVLVKGSNYLELMSQLDTVVSDKTGTLTKGVFAVLNVLPASDSIGLPASSDTTANLSGLQASADTAASRSSLHVSADTAASRSSLHVSADSPAPDALRRHGDEDMPAQKLLRLAALAESMSTHPIALSILDAYKKTLPDQTEPDFSCVKDAQNVSGQGIIASIAGDIDGTFLSTDAGGASLSDAGNGTASAESGVHTILAGNERLLLAHQIPVPEHISARISAENAASTIIHIALDGQYLGAILIGDEIKQEAAGAIAAMKQAGVREVVMLTGDREAVGASVAESLGIDTVFAGLLPQDKVLKVEELLRMLSSGTGKHSHLDASQAASGTKAAASSAGRKLAFIGDGINDAPVLSRADVGIAMGSMGSDAAIEAADIVIMDDNLSRIPETIRIARKTVGISKQNIVFALIVKCVILVLGALGMAGMWAAVFADVGVAVLCILNSMRLLRYTTMHSRNLSCTSSAS